MSKKVSFGDSTREKLKVGVNTVANAVKVTMGARGRIVLIRDDFQRNHPTKDGYTVAKHIYLEDNIENMGASMVIEAAKNTVDEAGDGTTTTTVLTQAIFEAGYKNIAAGANPIDVKEGIDKAIDFLLEYLDINSEEVGEDINKIRQVATISANNDPTIGNLIADAIEAAGYHTVIKAEPSNSGKTYVDVVKGLEFEQGYKSPYFVTDLTKMTADHVKPVILLLDTKVSMIQSLEPALKYSLERNKPLVIVANEMTGEVLETLVMNKRQGRIQVSVVNTPYLNHRRKEFLEDIATLTGATVISDKSGVGFESFKPEMLGTCKKVVIKKDSTAIIGGAGAENKVERRVKTLKNRLKNATDPRDKKFLKERVAKMSGGVAIMYVGANTESELKEKMDRVDDALAATQAAIEEGITSGGGVSLLKAIPSIDLSTSDNQDQTTGMKVVIEAIKQPFLQIVLNGGKGTPQVIMDKVLDNEDLDYGYDVKNNEFVNMKEAGIIDPTKVLRVSLQSARSVSLTLLSTEATITDV